MWIYVYNFHRMSFNAIHIMQIIPKLDSGGVEQSTLEVANTIVKRKHLSFVVSGGGKMVGDLEKNGSQHFTLAVGGKSPFTFLLAKKLAKLISTNRIDILHVRSRMPAWLVQYTLRLIPKHSRPVLISTVHGAYSINFYSEVMVKADHIIANSDYTYQYITQNYPKTDPKKITVIHRGVANTEYYREYKPDPNWLTMWRESFPQFNEKYLITLPGRISRRKGHDDFIRLIKGLVTHIPNVCGLIVGGTAPHHAKYLASLKHTIEKEKLNSFIYFLDHRKDVKNIMAVSNLVTSLSIKPESFGRTILESLCLGTPVIAYDHGGAHEILTHLCPEGAVKLKSISEAIEKVLAFRVTPPRIAGKNKFTLETMLDKTIAIYENCCPSNT